MGSKTKSAVQVLKVLCLALPAIACLLCLQVAVDPYFRGAVVHAVVNNLPQTPWEQAVTWVMNNPGNDVYQVPDDVWSRLEQAADKHGVPVEQYIEQKIKAEPIPAQSDD